MKFTHSIKYHHRIQCLKISLFKLELSSNHFLKSKAEAGRKQFLFLCFAISPFWMFYGWIQQLIVFHLSPLSLYLKPSFLLYSMFLMCALYLFSIARFRQLRKRHLSKHLSFFDSIGSKTIDLSDASRGLPLSSLVQPFRPRDSPSFFSLFWVDALSKQEKPLVLSMFLLIFSTGLFLGPTVHRLIELEDKISLAINPDGIYLSYSSDKILSSDVALFGVVGDSFFFTSFDIWQKYTIFRTHEIGLTKLPRSPFQSITMSYLNGSGIYKQTVLSGETYRKLVYTKENKPVVRQVWFKDRHIARGYFREESWSSAISSEWKLLDDLFDYKKPESRLRESFIKEINEYYPSGKRKTSIIKVGKKILWLSRYDDTKANELTFHAAPLTSLLNLVDVREDDLLFPVSHLLHKMKYPDLQSRVTDSYLVLERLHQLRKKDHKPSLRHQVSQPIASMHDLFFVLNIDENKIWGDVYRKTEMEDGHTFSLTLAPRLERSKLSVCV